MQSTIWIIQDQFSPLLDLSCWVLTMVGDENNKETTSSLRLLSLSLSLFLFEAIRFQCYVSLVTVAQLLIECRCRVDMFFLPLLSTGDITTLANRRNSTSCSCFIIFFNHLLLLTLLSCLLSLISLCRAWTWHALTVSTFLGSCQLDISISQTGCCRFVR